jgi:predicted peptidase
MYFHHYLDEIEANYRVDKNRIYVTGLSMGGHGTWSLALSAEPNRFAAIAPVCGWADTTKANTISQFTNLGFSWCKR